MVSINHMVRWLLLYSTIYFSSTKLNAFTLRDYFHNSTLNAASELFHLFDQYVSMHGRDAVLNEASVCHRHYVVATYACPQAIGNHMHEFLNSFAGAFITNRTMVWRFCGRKPCQLDNEGDCNEYTTRLPWILSEWDFEKRWAQDKCDPSLNNRFHQIIPSKFKYQADQILVCCGLDIGRFGPDSSYLPKLEFGTLELHEFYALSTPNVRLTNSSRHRATELFRHGEDFAYGVLFRSSFQIKNHVTRANDEILSRHEAELTAYYNKGIEQKVIVKPVYIALHIRHSNVDHSEEVVDARGVRCVNSLWHDYQQALHSLHSTDSAVASNSIDDHSNVAIIRNILHKSPIIKQDGSVIHRPCVILIASDRKHEIDLWQNVSHLRDLGVNCTVLTTNHSVGAHMEWNEHGPFSGGLAMHDLDLLSRSDMFIGSSYATPSLYNVVSTFSMLMAALRATNGRALSISLPPHYLSECDRVTGARHKPNDVYLNKKEGYHCGNSLHLMLPIECPFWNRTDAQGPRTANNNDIS